MAQLFLLGTIATLMLIFYIISVLVPILVYVTASWVVDKFGGEASRYRGLLVLACILFFVSWYLPSPLIDGENTSFTTHFVGGGLFTGLLWLYLKYSLGWRDVWWLEGFSLFALVSALGCVNEIFELFVARTGIVHMTLADTSWDILANSLGALVVYVGYLVYDSRR